MNMSMTRALALGAAITFAAMAGAASNADAGGLKRHFKHKFHHLHLRHRHDGCGFYKWKWHKTGLFYWKKKYFICRGWW